MTRHLITGAQGLVGRHLVARILASDPAAMVLGLGRSTRKDRLSADGRYRYEAVALGDAEPLRACIAEFRPDCVFHLASALHSAPQQELEATNIEGTASLLRALEGSDARIVLASSASVYGHPQRLPIDEAHPCAPVNQYGSTKLAAERLALRHAGDVVVARIFTVVRPGQPEDHVCGRLAAQLASREAGARCTLAVGPLAPTRDFIDVRDVAAALRLVADRAAPGSAVNVASGVEVSIRDVLGALVRIANVEVRLVEQGEVAAGVARCVADVNRLRQLGFESMYRLEQSLRDLLEWYRQPRDHRGV
ncbi:MAG: NAD-dependent epimerase/dehydratase family protein [Deltaproteobacteria bacterium]